MRHYLIVDDNPALAENLAEIIRDSGDEVTIANSGVQAVALAEKRRFDALLTDMRMPVMTGAHVVHAIRRFDPGLPALVITAYTGDDDLAAARQEGLLGILPKPVPIDRLLSLLASARRNGLVVVVEDDVSLSDNLCEVLRDRGFSAVTAASVIDADRLGGVAPFAALVDLRVPGGPDGEALRRVETRFPNLPRFVITAHSDQVGSLDEVPVFLKPFDTEALLRRLETTWRPEKAA